MYSGIHDSGVICMVRVGLEVDGLFPHRFQRHPDVAELLLLLCFGLLQLFGLVIFIQIELYDQALLVQEVGELVDNVLLDVGPLLTHYLAKQHLALHLASQPRTHLHLEGPQPFLQVPLIHTLVLMVHQERFHEHLEHRERRQDLPFHLVPQTLVLLRVMTGAALVLITIGAILNSDQNLVLLDLFVLPEHPGPDRLLRLLAILLLDQHLHLLFQLVLHLVVFHTRVVGMQGPQATVPVVILAARGLPCRDPGVVMHLLVIVVVQLPTLPHLHHPFPL